MSPTTGTRQSGRGKTQDGDTEVEVWGARKTDPHSARESARTAKAAAAKGDKETCTTTLHQQHWFMISLCLKNSISSLSDHLCLFFS